MIRYDLKELLKTCNICDGHFQVALAFIIMTLARVITSQALTFSVISTKAFSKFTKIFNSNSGKTKKAPLAPLVVFLTPRLISDWTQSVKTLILGGLQIRSTVKWYRPNNDNDSFDLSCTSIFSDQGWKSRFKSFEKLKNKEQNNFYTCSWECCYISNSLGC